MVQFVKFTCIDYCLIKKHHLLMENKYYDLEEESFHQFICVVSMALYVNYSILQSKVLRNYFYLCLLIRTYVLPMIMYFIVHIFLRNNHMINM